MKLIILIRSIILYVIFSSKKGFVKLIGADPSDNKIQLLGNSSKKKSKWNSEAFIKNKPKSLCKHQSRSEKYSHSEDIGDTIVTLDLDIKKRKSDKVLISLEFDDVRIYTSKLGYLFKSVKQKNKLIWEAKNTFEYSDKVIVNGIGSPKKTLTIHTSDKKKKFRKDGKNKPWKEIEKDEQIELNSSESENGGSGSVEQLVTVGKTSSGDSSTNKKNYCKELDTTGFRRIERREVKYFKPRMVNHSEQPPMVKIITIDDSNPKKSIQNDHSKYKLKKGHNGECYYIFREDAKCIKVVINDSTVWEHIEGESFPSLVKHTGNFRKCTVVFESKYNIYTFTEGEWVSHHFFNGLRKRNNMRYSLFYS